LAFKNGDFDWTGLGDRTDAEVQEFVDDPEVNVYFSPSFTGGYINFQLDPSKYNPQYVTYGYGGRSRYNWYAGHDWHIDEFGLARNAPNTAGEDQPGSLAMPGPLLRKGMSYALDKLSLIERAAPYYERLLGPIYKAETEWYNPNLEPYLYDPELANAYFGDAGFGYDDEDSGPNGDRSQLDVVVSYNQGNLIRERIANDMKDQLEQYGIDVTVQSMEWSTYLSEQIYNHMYDICLLGITGGGGDPFGFFTAVLGSENIEPGNMPDHLVTASDPMLGPVEWIWQNDVTFRGLNFFSNWNPTLDALVLQGKMETSKTVQQILCNQAQEIVVEDAPAIWTYAVTTIRAIQANFHGFAGDSPWWAYADGPYGYIEIWDMEQTTETPTTPTEVTTAPAVTTAPGVTTAPAATTAPTEPATPTPAAPALLIFATLATIGVALSLIRRFRK
jgi:ABC-type transport system substrate-binding protein